MAPVVVGIGGGAGEEGRGVVRGEEEVGGGVELMMMLISVELINLYPLEQN